MEALGLALHALELVPGFLDVKLGHVLRSQLCMHQVEARIERFAHPLHVGRAHDALELHLVCPLRLAYVEHLGTWVSEGHRGVAHPGACSSDDERVQAVQPRYKECIPAVDVGLVYLVPDGHILASAHVPVCLGLDELDVGVDSHLQRLPCSRFVEPVYETHEGLGQVEQPLDGVAQPFVQLHEWHALERDLLLLEVLGQLQGVVVVQLEREDDLLKSRVGGRDEGLQTKLVSLSLLEV